MHNRSGRSQKGKNSSARASAKRAVGLCLAGELLADLLVERRGLLGGEGQVDAALG